MITMYIRYSKDVENREKTNFLIFLTKEKGLQFSIRYQIHLTNVKSSKELRKNVNKLSVSSWCL